MSDDRFSRPKRAGHVAVSYKGCVYIWGGYWENINGHYNTYFDPAELDVYSSITETWNIKKCLVTEDGPSRTTSPTACVIGEYMYLFGGYYDLDSTNDLFRLSLETFTWERLRPTGIFPSAVDKAVSWQYQNKFYTFGGYGSPVSVNAAIHRFDYVIEAVHLKGWTNQFFEYDPRTNEWQIPQFTGQLPLPRAAHAAAILNDHMYIFGGRHNQQRMNDLHYIDMKTMCWSGSLKMNGPIPEGRSWHSFTAVSSTHILLFGGFSHESTALGDCWLLHTDTLTWQFIGLPSFKPRLWHSTSVTIDDEVVIFGGYSSNIFFGTRSHEARETIFVRLSPKSLLRLCFDQLLQLPVLYNQWHTLPYSLHVVLHRRRDIKHLHGS